MNELLIHYVPILKEGLSMMLIGMGTVLAFLCTMIISMFIMSAIVRKLNEIFPEPVAQPAGGKVKKASSNDEEIAAAIVASMFRAK